MSIFIDILYSRYYVVKLQWLQLITRQPSLSSPYSISALGDSRRLSRSTSRKESLRLDPLFEEESSEEPTIENSKRSSLKETFLRGFVKKSSDDPIDEEPAISSLLGNNDLKDSGSHVGKIECLTSSTFFSLTLDEFHHIDLKESLIHFIGLLIHFLIQVLQCGSSRARE